MKISNVLMLTWLKKKKKLSMTSTFKAAKNHTNLEPERSLCCSLHVQDFHGLCDHRAGVYLAIDPHYEGLMEQNISMLYRKNTSEHQKV